jgi:hypothetical protein
MAKLGIIQLIAVAVFVVALVALAWTQGWGIK